MHYTIDVEAKTTSLSPLRHMIGKLADEAGVGPAAKFKWQLAVHEALVNALRYSDSHQPIHMHVVRGDGFVRIVIENDGPPFSLKKRSWPSDQSENGRGILMMKKLSDQLTYKRVSNRNQLSIVFRTGVKNGSYH